MADIPGGEEISPRSGTEPKTLCQERDIETGTFLIKEVEAIPERYLTRFLP
jgi:hypothetical protein